MKNIILSPRQFGPYEYNLYYTHKHDQKMFMINTGYYYDLDKDLTWCLLVWSNVLLNRILRHCKPMSASEASELIDMNYNIFLSKLPETSYHRKIAP